MHKKLEAELISLAHRILQMKNRHEAIALKEKAKALYENLAVLAFVDDYIATTPNLKTSKEELFKRIEDKIVESNLTPEKESSKAENTTIPKTKEPVKKGNKEIFQPTFDKVKIDIESLKSNQISLKEEMRDTVSADKTATLFEEDKEDGNKTLNDRLLNKTIQIGLNDRIAFVQHLFNFSQQEFNDVLSKLNSFKNENDAKKFLTTTVKSEYKWEGKEEYEERLIALIERKFA